ncbi:MAG: hypothetical protein JWO44_2767 [Bacteroidetes bacterium]|jgi:hypothetical protein|nr:hypothetical protein [Bacteroidota bacterium]
MTISEFNNLSMSRRSDLIWEWGYLVTNHKTGDHNTIVFSFEDFFVEIGVFIPENRTLSIIAVQRKQLNPAILQKMKTSNPIFNRIISHLKRSASVVA